MHVAGSIHADATSHAPVWLVKPDDVNVLDKRLWSSSVVRDRAGMLTVAGRTLPSLVEEIGTPAYLLDELDFRARARSWREAFAGRESVVFVRR